MSTCSNRELFLLGWNRYSSAHPGNPTATTGAEQRLDAYSGETALELIPKLRPDVVLLDIGLPDTDGYEVARRVQLLPNAPHLIALSGYGQVGDKQRSAEEGFDLHLVKPVDITVLTAIGKG